MSNPFALDTPTPTQPTTTAAATVQQPTTPVQQTAPAQQAAPAAQTGGDPFAGPAPQAERPRIRDLVGRLLLIRPLLVEKVLQKDDDGVERTVNRMTADVIVLDGGPLNYGGAPEKVGGRPHDKVAAVPYRVEGMYISSVGIVSQCRDALAKRAAGQPGMVLGRLGAGVAKSAQHNPPYLISEYTPDEAAVCRQYLATIDPFA